MGMIKLEIPYTVADEEAKARVHALFEYWVKKFGVTHSWDGEKASFKGKVMGISLNGSLSVTASRVSGEATDPGMLLRGQAQKYLLRKFNEWLDPKKTVQQLQSDR